MSTILSSFQEGLRPWEIEYSYAKVVEVVREYYGPHCWFFLLAVFSAVFLFFDYPEIRKKLLLSLFLLVSVIIQPFLMVRIFYRVIYWRLFWIIPDAILIALAITRLLKRSKRNGVKFLSLLLLCILLAWLGKSNYADGRFVQSQNPYKIQQNVIDISDVMLSLDESPHVIALDTHFCEIREYNGNIILAYGRDVFDYIMQGTQQQKDAYFALHSADGPDFETLLPLAIEGNYDFIISYFTRPMSANLQKAYGFREERLIGNFIIYYSPEVHQQRLNNQNGQS